MAREFPTKLLEYDEEGRLLLLGRPVILIGKDTVAELQHSVETVLGERTARLAFYHAGLSLGRGLSQRYSDIEDHETALKEMIGWASLAGWASKMEVVRFTESPPGAIVRAWGTYAENYPTKSREGVCHLVSGLLAGFLSGRLGQRLLARETACLAKGDSYCEFVISGR